MSCRQSKKNDISLELKAYKEARAAEDFAPATALLLQIAAKDSAGNAWVYDSLALYHTVYLQQPNLARNTTTVKYYVNKGLKLNPNNEFLTEMNARVMLDEGKDTAAFLVIKGLWEKTGDYTYLWEMTLIELLRRRVTVVDSMINKVLQGNEADNRTVRVLEQVPQTVNARVAFYYIRATLSNAMGDMKKTAESLQECLKIAPNFLLAQKAWVEFQQNQQAGTAPKR